MDRRVALIVGCQDYAAMPKLKGPLQDENVMQLSLEECAFEVTHTANLKLGCFTEALADFTDGLERQPPADLAVFFFSGHALSKGGKHYLATTNAADCGRCICVEDQVIPAMAAAKHALLFLNCCRTVPGVANDIGFMADVAIRTPSSTPVLVQYACMPGATAKDGGINFKSVFMEALRQHLFNDSHVSLLAALGAVEKDTFNKSQGSQRPMQSSNNAGAFSNFKLPLVRPTSTNVEQWLQWLHREGLDLPDKKVIGLYGMGGMGKSTLGRAAGDSFKAGHPGRAAASIYVEFDLNFAADPKSLEAKIDQTCQQLQDVKTVQQLRDKMRVMPVLLVLDNVTQGNARSIMTAFLGDSKPDMHSDTRVLVISRDEGALESARCNPRLHMKGMDDAQAQHMSTKHFKGLDSRLSDADLNALLPGAMEYLAFARHGRPQQFVPLMIEAVAAAMGSQKSREEAQGVLDTFKRSASQGDAERRVISTLKTSYELLHDEAAQALFLDIVVSRPDGMRLREEIAAWFAAVHFRELHDSNKMTVDKQQLGRLRQLSLVRVDEEGVVTVHDLYVEVAMDIVKGTFPRFVHHPLHSQELCAWERPAPADACPAARRVLLTHVTDTDLDGSCLAQYRYVTAASFANSSLVSLPAGPISTWTMLRSLEVSGCSQLRYLPDLSRAQQLRYLLAKNCLRLDSLPQLDLPQVQRLHLSGSWALKELPDIGQLTALQQLQFYNCRVLRKLPNSVGQLKELQQLHLSGCRALEKLPNSIGQLIQLQQLHLSGYRALKELPASMGQLQALQQLDLSGCKVLRQLPESMGQLTALQQLDVSACKALEQLPDSMCQLTMLQQLHLPGCRALKELPASIGQLTMLQQLDLSACNVVEQLPDSVGQLTALQQLDLSGCHALKQLPASLGQIKALQQLHLPGCCALKELPVSIGQLKALQRLCLSGCRALEELPASVGQLTALQQMDLSGCKVLQQLPDSVSHLTALQQLNLSACEELERLPASLYHLTLLQQLQLCQPRALNELPDSVGQLTALQQLHLSKCEALKKLPASIGQLTALQQLHLSKCEALKELPASIGQLTALQELNLHGCLALENLPGSVGQLTLLQWLYMSGCGSFKKLPACVGQLTALLCLHLSGCVLLKELPATVGQLTALQQLGLCESQVLKELPDSVGQLTALRQLNLSGCQALQELPTSVGQLTALRQLNLSGCQVLQELPTSVGQLTFLMQLDLSGCCALRELPNSVVQLTTLWQLDLAGSTLQV